MPEMLRIKTEQIKIIILIRPVIFMEIVHCQYAAVHRRSFIRVRTGLSQIIIKMFREYAEAQLIKS